VASRRPAPLLAKRCAWPPSSYFQIKLAVEGLSTGFVVVSEVGMSRLNILPRVAGISHCDSRGPITPRRSASRDDSCNVPVNIFRWMPTASML
jgi:hypothetical protein